MAAAVANDPLSMLITNIVCTPLSIAGAAYLLYHYYKSEVKTFPGKLITAIAYTDLLLSVVNLVSMLNNYSIFCNIEGFLMSLGIYSNVLWTVSILVVLYLQFVKNVHHVEKYFNIIFVTNLILALIPGILTSISMMFDGPLFFGPYLGNCCIGPLNAYVYLMIIPFGIIFTFGIVLLIRVYRNLKYISETLANTEYKTLFSFAAVLMFLYIPISIDYSLKQLFYPLTLFCLISFKLVGLINAFQYKNSIRRRAALKLAEELPRERTSSLMYD